MVKQEPHETGQSPVEGPESAPEDVERQQRRAAALQAIRRNSAFSAVAGLIPLPIIDVAAVTALQVKMLAEMSAIYDVPFSENAVKASVAALIGGSLPIVLVARGGFSLAKAIPVAGQLAAIAVVPALSAAVTWAVGRVFLAHFESGGTTLDFDASKMKDRFQEELAKARKRGKAEV